MAIISAGTTMTVNAGAQSAHVTLGEIKTIDGLDGYSVAEIKTTNLSSTLRTKSPGLGGYGDITVELYYTRTAEQLCRTIRGVAKEFKATMVNGDYLTITGFCKDYSVGVPEAESTDPVSLKMTISVNDTSFTAGN